MEILTETHAVCTGLDSVTSKYTIHQSFWGCRFLDVGDPGDTQGRPPIKTHAQQSTTQKLLLCVECSSAGSGGALLEPQIHAIPLGWDVLK